MRSDFKENEVLLTNQHTSDVVVSIIMPVNNCQAHIVDAVESIVHQSFEDWELIIVDDCSVDDTLQLIMSFSDLRIRIIKCQDKIGIARALNVGIENSRGRFIARMDGDDIAAPERLSKQLEYLSANPDLALIGCQAQLIAKDGKIIGTKRKPVSSLLCRWYARYATPLIHPTFFGRREVFINLRGYALLPRAQDFEFITRVLNLGYRIGNHPECLFYYRIHPISTHRIWTIFESNRIAWMLRRRLNPLRDQFPPPISQLNLKFVRYEANSRLCSSCFRRFNSVFLGSQGIILNSFAREILFCRLVAKFIIILDRFNMRFPVIRRS